MDLPIICTVISAHQKLVRAKFALSYCGTISDWKSACTTEADDTKLAVGFLLISMAACRSSGGTEGDNNIV